MRNAKKRASRTSEIWTMVIFGVLFFIAFIFAFKVGIERQAKADCLKWQSWDKDYVLFEPSTSMLNECRILGVDLKN